MAILAARDSIFGAMPPIATIPRPTPATLPNMPPRSSTAIARQDVAANAGVAAISRTKIMPIRVEHPRMAVTSLVHSCGSCRFGQLRSSQGSWTLLGQHGRSD